VDAERKKNDKIKIPVVIVLHNKIQRWPNSEIFCNIIEIPLQEDVYLV